MLFSGVLRTGTGVIRAVFVECLEYYISLLENAAIMLIVFVILSHRFSMIWFHLGPTHLIVDGIGLPH